MKMTITAMVIPVMVVLVCVFSIAEAVHATDTLYSNVDTDRGGFTTVVWQWQCNGSGAASAVTDQPVYGTLYRAYVNGSTGTANSYAVTVKEMVGGSVINSDITGGNVGHNAGGLKAVTVFPNTAIPVASHLRLDLSGVSNTGEIGASGTAWFVFSPIPTFIPTGE